ncbi:hypothetical protein JTB14_021681 [Gonioctena quinquepunctata]|nr:hypothetical protein JTB14_021681 [Gonioctena quinquepunctata]
MISDIANPQALLVVYVGAYLYECWFERKTVEDRVGLRCRLVDQCGTQNVCTFIISRSLHWIAYFLT